MLGECEGGGECKVYVWWGSVEGVVGECEVCDGGIGFVCRGSKIVSSCAAESTFI